MDTKDIIECLSNEQCNKSIESLLETVFKNLGLDNINLLIYTTIGIIVYLVIKDLIKLFTKSRSIDIIDQSLKMLGKCESALKSNELAMNSNFQVLTKINLKIDTLK